ncbi:uncharacterized protein LOC144433676 [Glandiceps talaboti]
MADGASKFLDEIDEDFLVCAICMEQYRNAKLLPCLHTYCESCIIPLIRESGKIKCPLCSRKHNVPPGGVKEFSTFFFLNQLVERFRDRDRVSKSDTPETKRTCEKPETHQSVRPKRGNCVDVDERNLADLPNRNPKVDAFESFMRKLEELYPGLTREELITKVNKREELRSKHLIPEVGSKEENLSTPVTCTDISVGSSHAAHTNSDSDLGRLTSLLGHLSMNPANERRVTEQDLLSVADKMGEDWESVGIKLGFKNHEIYRFKEQHRGETQKIFAMLMKWKKKKGAQATVKNLCQELCTAGVDLDSYNHLVKK